MYAGKTNIGEYLGMSEIANIEVIPNGLGISEQVYTDSVYIVKKDNEAICVWLPSIIGGIILEKGEYQILEKVNEATKRV